LVVGVLAQVVTRFGGAEVFQFQAIVVLVGMAGLAVLLPSDRARRAVYALGASHFWKAPHDLGQIWAFFLQRLATVKDQAGLCALSAKLISETFNVLSVTIWLVDEEEQRLIVGASTARTPKADGTDSEDTLSSAVSAGLAGRSVPFDLEGVNAAWAEE